MVGVGGGERKMGQGAKSFRVPLENKEKSFRSITTNFFSDCENYKFSDLMELAIRIMSDQLRYDGRSFYHNLSDVSMSMKLIYN